MIRLILSEITKYGTIHKYEGGFLARVPDPPIYDRHYPLLYRNLQSGKGKMEKTPLLKKANWKVIHELGDFHNIQIKLKRILKKRFLQKTALQQCFREHEWIPDLVMSFIKRPQSEIATRLVENNPAPSIKPRDPAFKPAQVLFGTLISRGIIQEEAWIEMQPEIQRAVLCPPVELKPQQVGAPTRLSESRRHYILDPDEWYQHWPATRHTPQAKKYAVYRLLINVMEKKLWNTTNHITYKKKIENEKITWEPYLSSHPKILREISKLSECAYETIFV